MINRIDEIFAELNDQRKTEKRKSIAYYAGVRLDISESISFLLENKHNLEIEFFNKYIHRCNVLMDLAEGLKKDVNSRATNIERVIRNISIERDGGELWAEVLQRVRDIKKENINQ